MKLIVPDHFCKFAIINWPVLLFAKTDHYNFSSVKKSIKTCYQSVGIILYCNGRRFYSLWGCLVFNRYSIGTHSETGTITDPFESNCVSSYHLLSIIGSAIIKHINTVILNIVVHNIRYRIGAHNENKCASLKYNYERTNFTGV